MRKFFLFIILALIIFGATTAFAEMLMRVDLVEDMSIRQIVKESNLEEEYQKDVRLYGRKSFWYLIRTYNQIHRIDKQGWLWVPISYEAEKTIRKIFRKEQFESIGIKDIKLF